MNFDICFFTGCEVVILCQKKEEKSLSKYTQAKSQAQLSEYRGKNNDNNNNKLYGLYGTVIKLGYSQNKQFYT